jgi:hypothetical protein
MALAAMFAALMVATGWALAMVPNVELITALAFVAGTALGPRRGALIGAGGMFLFSATNPVGSGLAFPLLLGSQMVSLSMTGFLGGLLAKLPLRHLERLPGRFMLAGMGLLITLFYDGLTSVSFPLFSGAGAREILAVLVSGLAFTITHQVSNAIILPRMVGIARGGSWPTGHTGNRSLAPEPKP